MTEKVNCQFIRDEKFCANPKVKKGWLSRRRKCVQYESFALCEHFMEWDPYKYCGTFGGVHHKLERVDGKTDRMVPISDEGKYHGDFDFIFTKTNSTGPR